MGRSIDCLLNSSHSTHPDTIRVPPPGQFSSTIPSPVSKVGAFSVKESLFPVPDETKINGDCVYCFGSLLNCHSQQLEGRFPGMELTFLIVGGF